MHTRTICDFGRESGAGRGGEEGCRGRRGSNREASHRVNERVCLTLLHTCCKCSKLKGLGRTKGRKTAKKAAMPQGIRWIYYFSCGFIGGDLYTEIMKQT